MISLMLAGSLYSLGLVMFVYSSKQVMTNSILRPSEKLMNFQVFATKIVATILSAVSVLGLLYLSFAFIMEQWKFQQATGAIGRALTRHSLSARIINVLRSLFRAFRYVIRPMLGLQFLIL